MATTTPTEATGIHRARTWRATAASGVALLVLVTIHMIAHHFVVEEVGGLRNYAQVLDYISNPVMFAIEIVFWVVASAGITNLMMPLVSSWLVVSSTTPSLPSVFQ